MNKFLSSLLISLSLFSFSFAAEANPKLDDSFVEVSAADTFDRSSESGELSYQHLVRLKDIAAKGEAHLNAYLTAEFGGENQEFWKIFFLHTDQNVFSQLKRMNQTNARTKVEAFFTYADKGYNADYTLKAARQHLFNTQYSADAKVVAPKPGVAGDTMAFNGFVNKVIRWTGDPTSFGILQNFYTQALDQSVHSSPLQDAMKQLNALSITE